MLPSMRFYIISIVSIFAALGIGIFIGFTIDTQGFIIDQNHSITEMVESQFEVIFNENRILKDNEKILEAENKYKDEYIDNSYNFIIKDKLEGLNVGIIETNDDYITSGIGRDLELAGAKVINVTTLNNSIMNKEQLDELFEGINISIPKDSIETSITIITESIISGDFNLLLNYLSEEDFISTTGNYNKEIDFLILCGGSFSESSKRINKVDKLVVDIGKKYNIPIIGIEKSNVNYSYISRYKDFNISTIDNIDMVIGKVAMILAMEGNPGNYGIKITADSVIPNYNLTFQE